MVTKVIRALPGAEQGAIEFKGLRMGFDRSFDQARYFSLQFSGKNSTFSKIYTGGDGCNGDGESKSGDTRDYEGVTSQINDRTCMRATGDESERILVVGRHFADDNSSVSVGVECCNEDEDNLGGRGSYL